MRDKLLQVRADKDFCEKVDYLRQINGYSNNSETVRKIIEKEYRKETQINQERAEAIDNIISYLDYELHPVVSPDNWYVYAELHDMISALRNRTQ